MLHQVEALQVGDSSMALSEELPPGTAEWDIGLPLVWHYASSQMAEERGAGRSSPKISVHCQQD